MTHRGATPDELLAHAGWLRELCRRLCRDEAAAEDLAQEAWVTALSRAPSAERDLRPWIARVAARLARHARRSDLRRRERELRASVARNAPAADELLAALEAQRELARLVADLPETYRLVVLRRYYAGLSAAEIARRTGVPAGSVRSQLARAHAALRLRWRERDEHARGLALIAALAPRYLLPGAWIVKTSTKLAWIGAAAVLAAVAWIGADALRPESSARGSALDVAPAALDPAQTPLAPPPAELAHAPEEERAPATGAAAVVAPGEAASAARLLARAVDASGRPVANALLTLRTADGASSPPGDVDGRVALTVPDELFGERDGRSFVLALSAPNCATRFLRASAVRGRDVELGELALAAGGELTGRVIDELGRPLAEARVLATGPALAQSVLDARLGGPEEGLGLPETRTGASGEYVLAGVTAGDARVWARHGDGPWGFSEPLAVPAGARALAPDVVIPSALSGQRIAGRVLDPRGEPVARAPVVALALVDGPFQIARTETDSEGRFELVAPCDAPHLVKALDPADVLRATYESGVLPGRADLELSLAERRFVELRIVDAVSREPIAEPWAHVDDPLDHGWYEGAVRLRVETLAAGHVRVELPQTEFTIRVGAPGHAGETLGPFEPDSAAPELHVEMRRLPRIRGRVLADGEPVAGVTVGAAQFLGPDFPMMQEGFPQRVFGGERGVETDAEGRFELPADPEWKSGWALLARAEGFATAELGPLFVDPERGLEGVELELGPGGAIEGRVLLAPGRDPVGRLVAASRGDGDVLTTRTGADGGFRFERLTPGPWQVRARESELEVVHSIVQGPHETEYRGDCVVSEGAVTRHDIDLRVESVSVHGRVAFNGAPAAGWSARLEPEEVPGLERTASSMLLDDQGAFRLTGPAGFATLVIEAPASADRSVAIACPLELRTEEVERPIELATGELEVSAPAGTSLKLAWSDPSGLSWTASLTVGEAGALELDHVPAGTVNVERRFMLPGSGYAIWTPAGEVEVETHGVARLELE